MNAVFVVEKMNNDIVAASGVAPSFCGNVGFDHYFTVSANTYNAVLGTYRIQAEKYTYDTEGALVRVPSAGNFYLMSASADAYLEGKYYFYNNGAYTLCVDQNHGV